MPKKTLKSWLVILPFVFLAPSLFLNFFQYRQNQNLAQGIKVIEVLDGDTLLLEGKVRLRLRHLDAPELEFCGGGEAKEELAKLVKNKKVLIKEQILDTRGRPMALIYLGSELVNQKMLASGWVRYHSDQSSAAEALKNAGVKAKEQQLGVFSPKCYQKDNPDNPQCNIKGNIDKNSTKRLYYLPNCAQYQFTIVEKDLGENWFCSEEEARAAGFTKAATCK